MGVGRAPCLRPGGESMGLWGGLHMLSLFVLDKVSLNAFGMPLLEL